MITVWSPSVDHGKDEHGTMQLTIPWECLGALSLVNSCLVGRSYSSHGACQGAPNVSAIQSSCTQSFDVSI